ncbi:MAG: sel1 repeat family protein [Victivallales bacterium]|nr:sel1 repeat family protein [Victivallales bacterium]
MSDMDKNSDKRFEYLLGKAIAKTVTYDEDNELFKLYFDTDNQEWNFAHYLQAAKQGYIGAYASLGRAYLLGEGCEQSDDLAVEYLNKSVESGGTWGHGELGDCHRLGKGVPVDYELAWKFYNQAREDGEQTLDGFEIRALIRFNFSEFAMSSDKIPVEWWEFVATKVGDDRQSFASPKDFPCLCAHMADLYQKGTPRWLHWIEIGAQGGNYCCLQTKLDMTKDEDERKRYITALFNIDCEEDFPNEQLARIIMNGDYPKELQDKAFEMMYEFDLWSDEEKKDALSWE